MFTIRPIYRLKQIILLSLCIGAAACQPAQAPQPVRVTIPPTQIGAGAPIYSPTPSFTPTSTHTQTPTPTITPSLTVTPSLTITPSLTTTPSRTPTLTRTPSPSPTMPLLTLTPAQTGDAPAKIVLETPVLSATDGWSCGDFPCEEDIEGFLQRIQVPEGFTLSHAGRFPGQPLQIVYGPDDRIYATVLEEGTRIGRVYALNSDGSAEAYSEQFFSPLGLAFQPGTDVLYVSARLSELSGGGLWRILPDGTNELVIDQLPCCYNILDNQPNGMIFGPDGYLYLGVGALTDHGESPNPANQAFADIQPREAAILRIQPHTGEIEVYAQGIRNPFDLAFAPSGQLYASDNGMVAGPGDRLLAVEAGAHYGWPYWRPRGCDSGCPPRRGTVEISPDWLTLPDYTLPRGMAVYTGNQFPQNFFGTLFVSFWNGTDWAQRIAWIDPASPALASEAYTPAAFVTGLIRPVDVVMAPDGSLVVADFIYGHLWKISYTGESPAPSLQGFSTPTPSAQPENSPTPPATLTETPAAANVLFATATPRP